MKFKLVLIYLVFSLLFSANTFALETYDYVSIKSKEYSSAGDGVVLELVTPTQTKQGKFTYVFFNHGSTTNFGSSTAPVLVSSLVATSSTLSSYKLEIKGLVPGQYYYARAVRLVASSSGATTGEYAVSGTESIFITPKKTAPEMKGVSSRSGLCVAEDCELTVYENSPVYYDIGTVNASVSSYFFQSKDFKFDSGNEDNIFGIDYNGKITIAKPNVLDVDQKNEYKLVVRAFDSNTPSLFSTRKITIKILPKENNPSGSGVTYNPGTPGGYGTSTYQGSSNYSYDPGAPGGYGVLNSKSSSRKYSFEGEAGGYDYGKNRGVSVYASYNPTPGGYDYRQNNSSSVLNLSGKTREEAIREISKKILELQIEYLKVKLLEDQGRSNASY